MYRIFPSISRDFFFKNFTVAAYIAVWLMCGRFQKTTHYTLHAAACLDQHLITISSPTVLAITDCLCSRVATPPPPAVSLSLSLSVCVCLVSHSNGSQLHCSTWQPSTARTDRAWENSRLKSSAGHAALAPRWQ